MSSNRIALWLGGIASALALVGCSGESDPSTPASIVSFQSSPSEIESGRWATLAWETRDANRVEIVEVGGDSVAIGNASVARGSVQVSPVATTNYELRAYGESQKIASQVTTVTVLPRDAMPSIVSFLADPEVVTMGDEVTLSWQTHDATSLRVVDAAGTAIATATGEDVKSGQIKLKPRASTSYHLVAKGPGGEAERQVSVAVHGLPVVTLRAPAEAIEPGGEATLRWSATNALRVIISDEAGSVVYDGADAEGEVTVEPLLSTAYTAVAKGETGDGNARVTVAVRPVVELFEARVSAPVYPGDEVDLHWKVSGARELSISRLGLDAWVVPAESLATGTVRLPAGTDGSFRLRARSGSLLVEAVAVVPMQPLPRILDMAVAPEFVSADEGHAAPVTVSWFIDGASRVQLERDDGSQVNVNGISPRKGSVVVDINGTTTFRLTALNDHGTTLADRQVIAHRAPAIDSFVVLPTRAGVGEEIKLFWATSDAERIVLEKVEEGVLSSSEPAASGSFGDVVLADSTYVLKAYNVLDFETVSEPVSVVLGEPVIEHFAADRVFVRPGLPVTLTWRNHGGQSLEITDEAGAPVVDLDGNACATTNLFDIVEGSCVVAGPGVGPHSYTLTLRNAASPAVEAVEVFEVESLAGPVVTSFEVVNGTNTVGQPVTFNWTMTEDVVGADALVELSVDGEVFYASTVPAQSGTLDYAFPTAGMHQVRLRAYSPEGDHSLVRGVDIRGIASIDVFAASPSILDSTEGPLVTTFSWDWKSARTARIHRLDAAGQAIEPPVLVLDAEGEDSVGSREHELEPGIYDFILLIDNQAGSTAEARTHVEADKVEASLTANKIDLMPGDDLVTLTWETKHAAEVRISPLALTAANRPAAQEIETPFFDIATLPGVQDHDLTTGTTDGGLVHIEFPAGFAFPYDGSPRTAVRAWVDGVLSFDLTNTGGGSNEALPYTGTVAIPKRVHMALFWGDLHMAVDANHPRAKVLSVLSEDEKGPFFAIQWSGIHAWSSNARPSNFNFQAILRQDGSWEYRYGNMSSTDAYALGRFSTIGYQNEASTVGYTLSHKADVEGGVANRSWSFELAPLQANGSMEVPVTKDTEFTVWARNDYSSASDSVHTVFWEKPVITATAPAEIGVGEGYTITWSATHSSRVEVIAAADGTVLCTAATPDGTVGLLEGECAISRPEGKHDFVVRAVGGLEANVTEAEFSVNIYRPFELTTLSATPDTLMPGETVTLSWETVGAAVYELKANGVDVAMPAEAVGSMVLTPAVTTTYVLTIKDAPVEGLSVRTLTASASVVVRTNTLDNLSVSQTQFAGGSGPQSVTLTWQSTNADGVQVLGVTPFAEVEGPARFEDIRTSPGAVELVRTFGTDDEGGYAFTLPAGFNFVYDGEPVTDVTASTNGWLSFSQVTSGWVSANGVLPSAVAVNAKLHLLPFWDDLRTQNMYMDQGVDAELGPYVVIQWTAITYGSTAGTLNFQAVLFENGMFEYRYGAMAASQTGRADASSATIGHQNRLGTTGHAIVMNTVVEGGLSDKTWRFTPVLPADGSVAVEISDSTDFVVCSVDATHRDCQTISVIFIKPFDLLISEIMANPGAGGADAQWVEIRNITRSPIDLNGFALENGAGATHTIAQSIVVPAGGFALLTRGNEAVNGGIGADYVYGNAILLDAEADTIKLKLGAGTIDSIAWTADWEMPVGKSLSLDGSYHLRVGGNGVRGRWCESTEPMTSGAFGSPGYRGADCRLVHYSVDWLSDRPFIDIASTGSEIAKLNADSGYDAVGEGRPIGFSFPFFDGNYTEWYGHSNGFISFAGMNNAHSANPTAVPSNAAPNNYIAAYWDDLTLQAGSSVKTQLLSRDGQLVRVVQWTGTLIWNQAGSITFQIQLWENGDIVTAYKDIVADTDARMQRYLGSSVTVGIEDSLGTTGLPYSINQAWLYEGAVLAFERK